MHGRACPAWGKGSIIVWGRGSRAVGPCVVQTNCYWLYPISKKKFYYILYIYTVFFGMVGTRYTLYRYLVSRGILVPGTRIRDWYSPCWYSTYSTSPYHRYHRITGTVSPYSTSTYHPCSRLWSCGRKRGLEDLRIEEGLKD